MTPEDCLETRIRLGWSREQLARAAGLTVKTLQTFESGERQPRQGTVIAIRRALRRAMLAEGLATADA